MKPASAIQLLAFALVAFATPGVTDEPVKANVYLITHSEVGIVANPAAIWPFILDTSEWKTLAESSHISGEPDQPGEIELVRGGQEDSAYQFYIETLELIPEKRKVVAIYFDKEASGDVSYAAWTLFKTGNTTMVTYDVYSINRIPGLTKVQITAVRKQMTQPSQERLDRELRLLKRLVEAN